MPKFMIKASYNTEGAKGLMKEGGSARRAVVQKLVESLGGKVEAFYFAYGEDDAYIIADLPDAATGIAISLTVNASGAVRLSTTPLITPEELDAASKKTVSSPAAPSITSLSPPPSSVSPPAMSLPRIMSTPPRPLALNCVALESGPPVPRPA